MRSKILLLSIFIPALVNAGAWSFYGHDTLRTGVSPYNGPKDCGVICKVDIGYSYASPVIDGSGHLYIQGRGPGSPWALWYLWCINTSDCSVNWKYELGTVLPQHEFQSSCGISPVDGTIYVGYESALYAINPDSTLKWSYTTGGKVRSSPSVTSDGTIYVGCNDNYLYAINPDSTLKWKYNTGGTISSPAIGSDGTIYIGSYDKKLYAINPDSTLKWSYATGGAIESSPAVGSDGTIYVGSNDGYLYAINPDSILKWKHNTGGAVKSSPAIDNVRGMVYVGSNAAKICAIDTGGGLKWETPLLGEARHSSPAVAYPNNMVYIGAYELATSALYAIDGETGNIICTAPHDWEITSPAIDDPNNNAGDYCVWYNEWCRAIYKICSSPSGTEEKGSCMKDRFQLHLYPNPFVAATKISFTLPVKTDILLEVYDVSGRLIKRLAKGSYDAGEHTIEWNAEGIRKGIYFCKLRTETQTLIRKMILLRR